MLHWADFTYQFFWKPIRPVWRLSNSLLKALIYQCCSFCFSPWCHAMDLRSHLTPWIHVNGQKPNMRWLGFTHIPFVWNQSFKRWVFVSNRSVSIKASGVTGSRRKKMCATYLVALIHPPHWKKNWRVTLWGKSCGRKVEAKAKTYFTLENY